MLEALHPPSRVAGRSARPARNLGARTVGGQQASSGLVDAYTWSQCRLGVRSLATVALAAQLLAGSLAVNTQTPSECGASSVGPIQTVAASPGDRFSVVVDTQPVTGYSWTISDAPDPSVAQSVDSVLVPAATPRPGATEQLCFIFDATGACQTSIGFAYARSFEADTPPAKTLHLAVSVMDAQVPVQVPGEPGP